MAEDWALRDRLEWIEDMRKALVFLLGEDVVSETFKVHRDVDPLKVTLTIPLRRPMSHNSRAALRAYIRAWAFIGNCDVPRIDIEKTGVAMEVFTKTRHWNEKTHFRR